MSENTTKKTTRTRKTSAESTDKVEEVKVVESVAETPVKVEESAPVEAPKNVTTPKRTVTKIDPEELIECRSIVVGKLLLVGKKSRIQYRWENNNDVQYVEYQDLLAEMLSNSNVIYAPYILIEDDTILEDFRWKRVADLYEQMIDYQEIEQLLQLPAARFKSVLQKAPKGLKKAVANAVSTKVATKSFDSIQKIQIVDEVCGTDLTCLISK